MLEQHSFQEVMRQWRRFCKSHNHCGECEFDGKGICGEAHLSDVPYSDIELRIMAWAAEHPEPVYPTWYRWLTVMGAVASSDDLWTDLQQTIPADIAERLGIEPKGAYDIRRDL